MKKFSFAQRLLVRDVSIDEIGVDGLPIAHAERIALR